jgi:predicted RNA-binding protein with PUA-like domain
MKLTMNWGGKSQKPKASGTSQKVRWDLVGIRDPRKGPEPKSIEEIRKQAQIISSGGFRQSVMRVIQRLGVKFTIQYPRKMLVQARLSPPRPDQWQERLWPNRCNVQPQCTGSQDLSL